MKQAGLGETWEEFRDLLAEIRSRGYFQSAGEFTSGMGGIAAPIFNADQTVIGSIGLAWDLSRIF